MAEENQNQNTPPALSNHGQENEPGALQSAGAFIWDLVKILIIALVIILPFRAFVAEPFVVSGSSMLENFHNNDYLIVDRLSYDFSPPKRGDVIVLKFPKDTTQYYIKRIIGLPGDKVCFSPTCTGQDGHVYIFNAQYPQGLKLNEPYINQPTYPNGNELPVTLGSDEYFVLGDNRGASSDSRFWGILPKDDIVGKVWLRVYPFSTAGFFHTPTY